MPRRLALAAGVVLLAGACGGSDGPTARRSVSLTTVDYDVPELHGFTGTRGEEVTFTVRNTGTQPHNLELLTADGTRLGRLEVLQPGASGTFTARLTTAGTVRWVCDVGDHIVRGMRGSFTVS